MKLQTSGLIILLGLGGGLGFSHATVAIAQNPPPVLHRLPPPPPVREVPNSPTSPDRLPATNVPPAESTSVPPNNASVVREYRFRAPQTAPNPVPSNSSPRYSPTATELYRVEVLARSEAILARVRKVEPMAFVRRGETVIQVGLFRTRSQAEQRLHELKTQGLSARVVTVKNDIGTVDSVSQSR
jgi:cell division protein FtsN